MAKIDDSVKKKVPELRFKGFTDPWVQRNLSDLATFSKGKGYSKSDLVSDGFPAILYGRMYTNYESQIDDISDTFVADATDAVLSQTGDVIVPGSGETPEDIARASNVNVSGIVLGGDINIIRPDTEKMDSTFLALTISNGQQQTELIKRAQGKSVVHLHNSDLKKVNVVAPSKDEQSAISSLFTQLDSLIAANQRKLDLLKKQKKGYLQKMFPKNGAKVPELRFAGFADAWEERKLGELLKSAYQGINTAGDKVIYSEKGVEILQSKHITSGYITFDDTRFLDKKRYSEYFPKYVPKKHDILFANIGTIGPSAVVETNKEFLIAWNILKMTPNENVNSKFIELFLQILNEKHYYEKITTGNATKFVNKDAILNIELCISSFKEQQKIGSFFQQLDNTIALHQRKLDLLKEQKKGFLQKMFV